ncbi:MAG: MATE family efflux transporter [Actinomycetota bacterium]|nr:MATE family efflux transporter [Actinomycetota bacterium]
MTTSEFRAAFRRNPRDRAIAALAIPALGTLAIDPIVTIVDTAWVARLGTVPLAALAVAGAVFAAVFSLFNFVQVAVTPLIAGAVARDDLPRAGGIATGAVAFAAVVGVILAIAFVSLSSAVVELFGAEPEVATAAATYLRIRFLALPAMLIAMVGHGVYRGHQDTKTPLYVAVALNIVNLVLDPILIFGFDLGVAGAAWATVAAQFFAAGWFLVLMFSVQRARLGVGLLRGRVRSLGLLEVLTAGWPMIIRSIALLGAITATTAAAARLGAVETAAPQIALPIWLFLAFVLDSLAIAAMAMIGKDLGTNDRVSARALANRLLALGLLQGVGLSILLLATSPLVAIFFGVEPDVELSLEGIYILVIVLQPLTALVYVWDGIGVGAASFKFMALSMVVAGVCTVATLFLMGDTLFGIWTALVVLTGVRLVTFAGWHRWGRLSVGQDPSPSSQAVGEPAGSQ